MLLDTWMSASDLKRSALKSSGSSTRAAGVVLRQGRQICGSVSSQRMAVLQCSREMDVLNESSKCHIMFTSFD